MLALRWTREGRLNRTGGRLTMELALMLRVWSWVHWAISWGRTDTRLLARFNSRNIQIKVVDTG